MAFTRMYCNLIYRGVTDLFCARVTRKMSRGSCVLHWFCVNLEYWRLNNALLIHYWLITSHLILAKKGVNLSTKL